MVVAHKTWGEVDEAAYRRGFELWLAELPASWRHTNSIVYKGGGMIRIRSLVTNRYLEQEWLQGLEEQVQ